MADQSTVDDLLSRVSPSRFVGRQVVELGGHLLRAGQSVIVLLAAINWASAATPGARPAWRSASTAPTN